MSKFYTLDGREPVPAKTVTQWQRWYSTADRTVAMTRLGPIIVSTQFIGRAPKTDSPLLFETLIALDDWSDYCWRRYGHWSCAQRGHDEVVRMLGYVPQHLMMQRAREITSMKMDFAFPKFGKASRTSRHMAAIS